MRIKYALPLYSVRNTYCRRIIAVLAAQIIRFRLMGLVLFLFKQFQQFSAVGSNQFLLQLAALNFNGHIIIVGADETVAPLKMGDFHDFCLGKMEQRLHPAGFFFLQIEDDFGFCIIDDSFAVFSVLQGKEIIDVLRCTDGTAAISANDLEDLQNKLRRKAVTAGADQLPTLVDIDCLFDGTVLLGLIPDIVKRHEHAHRQKITG